VKCPPLTADQKRSTAAHAAVAPQLEEVIQVEEVHLSPPWRTRWSPAEDMMETSE